MRASMYAEDWLVDFRNVVLIPPGQDEVKCNSFNDAVAAEVNNIRLLLHKVNIWLSHCHCLAVGVGYATF